MTTMTRLALRASLAALVVGLTTVLSSAQTSDTRRLTRVPAPIGAAGERAELYTGSFALLVGIGSYDSTAWSRLDSIAGELAEVGKALREVGFESVEQSVSPTGQELRRVVEDFIRRHGYAPGNRLLFYFAGHGHTLDNGERGYFVPRDAPDPRSDEAGFRATALSMQQVATWAQDLVAKHAMFVFDSCFSGTIFRTRSSPETPPRISALTAKPVREFLSAGQANEPVPARSTFSPVFVRGLRGAADLDQDGYVTGMELGNYVYREVITYRTGQTPQFGKIRDVRYDEGDVVFAVPAPAPIPTTIDPDTALKTGIEKYRAKAYSEALPLLLRAGNAGKSEGAFYLGYMYDEGLGVAQDYALARKWYEQAATAGHPSAFHNLGLIYGAGHGVPADYTIALEWYRKAAAAGNASAMQAVGRYYEQGLSVVADKAAALTWYKKSAVRGETRAVQALERLGETDAVNWAKADPAEALRVGLERYGAGQRAEAFNPLLRAAASGKIEAAFPLGYLYRNGIGTRIEFDDARSWYEKSAAAGNAAAMNNLGALYDNGSGVPQNYQTALEWYRKAAALGSATAHKNIGEMYEYGHGVPANRSEAVSWYRKAADLKNDDAIKALARLGEPGDRATNVIPSTVDPDTALKTGLEKYRAKAYAEALPFLLRAGNAGKSEAAFHLGYMYDAALGVSQDYGLARKWYEQAAAAGHSTALHNLGVIYGLGHGVPVDRKTALDWYRKGAAAGDALAMHAVGLYLEQGFGIPADKAAALSWYKKSAMRGEAKGLQALERLGEADALNWARADPAEALKVGLERYDKGQRSEAFNPLLRAAASGKIEAAFPLGYLYGNGLGTPQDLGDARAWYEKSAASGTAAAMNNIGAMYFSGSGAPKSYETALEWYRKAAALGNAIAIKNIGALYEYGQGVSANRSEAVNWYRRAAELKNQIATDALTRLGESADGPSRTLTDARGIFSVPVNSGTYKVTFELRGFKKTEGDVKVVDGFNIEAVLSVGSPSESAAFVPKSLGPAQAGFIAGTVRDASGKTLPGVAVSVKKIQ
jgi:TPR repeat protein